MRPIVDPQKIERLMQVLGREAKGAGSVYFTGGAVMNFSDLPGAEFILPGLDDLHKGENTTIGALLIAIAATRLTNAGLDVPRDRLASEPELTLYARLQHERNDAYPYYNALLNRLHSFCNALELSRGHG